MDSFDGIAANRASRAETLTVLKDSRVGAFGAMAACIMLMVKLVSLASIDYQSNFSLLAFLFFVLPICSRLLLLSVLYFQTKNLDESSSLIVFKTGANKGQNFIISILLAKVFAWLFLLTNTLTWKHLLYADLIIISWLIASWFIYLWLSHKLKGHNGDSLGAGLEISESLFLLVLALLE
jgi:adenosylcobinamide-GDP ribazoletransferase